MGWLAASDALLLSNRCINAFTDAPDLLHDLPLSTLSVHEIEKEFQAALTKAMFISIGEIKRTLEKDAVEPFRFPMVRRESICFSFCNAVARRLTCSRETQQSFGATQAFLTKDCLLPGRGRLWCICWRPCQGQVGLTGRPFCAFSGPLPALETLCTSARSQGWKLVATVHLPEIQERRNAAAATAQVAAAATAAATAVAGWGVWATRWNLKHAQIRRRCLFVIL